MMNRNETIKSMIALLSKYEYEEGKNYTPTEYGCGVIFDTEMRNKGTLISALERHPRYNGKGQIVLDESFYRNRNEDIVREFRRYLERFKSDRECEYTFKHREVVRVKSEIKEKPSNWVPFYMDGWMGREVITRCASGDDVYCSLADEPYGNNNGWYFKVTTLEHLDGTPYCEGRIEREMTCDDFYMIDSIINDGQYLSKERAEKLNATYDWVRAHRGQKMSRVVKKMCDHFGVSKDREWNHYYTRFADAVNPLEVKTWTVISWNPVDYWTMSFGNSWTSCHSVDKTDINGVFAGSYHGAWSGGTESYMLDSASVVVYIVDKSYEGNEYELQPKVVRQMFHISPDGTSFVQGRLYPQDNDLGATEKYDRLRAIVQRVVSECFGTLNYWSVKSGTEACSDVIITSGVHYTDYLCFENCTVSKLKEGYTGAMIEVGHNPICPCCGETHGTEECVQCDTCCSAEYCENCDDRVDLSNNGIETYDHRYFCCGDCAERAGYVYCHDGCWHYENSEVCYDNWLCEYVWDYYEDFILTADGNTYSSEENAMLDGYVYAVDCYEWLPKEECAYCEENGEYYRDKEVA